MTNINAEIKRLRKALEIALDNAMHDIDCNSRVVVDSAIEEKVCNCWMRKARATLGEETNERTK